MKISSFLGGGMDRIQDDTMEDLDTPLYVQGRVMHETLKCLYVQGLLPDEPNPDITFYEDYFGFRLAKLLVNHPYILWAIKFTRNAYPWGNLMAMSIQIVIILPVHIYQHRDDKDLTFESVLALLLCCLMFMSLQLTFFRREDFKSAIVRLKHLINKDEKMDEVDPKNKLEKLEIWNKWCNQMNVRCVVPFFSLGVISYAAFSLIPERKLFTHGWYPFDVYATPIYELTMLAWALEAVLLFFLSNTLEIFGIFECYYLKVHFDNLCYKIRSIRNIAIRRIRERRRQRPNDVGVGADWMSPILPASNIDGQLVVRPKYELPVVGVPNKSKLDNLALFRPYIVINMPGDAENRDNAAYKRLKERALKEGLNEQGVRAQTILRARDAKREKIDILEGITSQELNKEMLFQQARFAKLHQDLISLSNHWGACLNTNLMVLYYINLVTFAITAVLLKTASAITFKEIMCVIVCGQLILFYFMYNFLFDLITHGSAAVADAVYDCDWYEASKPFKLTMLIMMSRANVPVQVTPTGHDPVSLRNFAVVAEKAYKMLTTMDSFF